MLRTAVVAAACVAIATGVPLDLLTGVPLTVELPVSRSLWTHALTASAAANKVHRDKGDDEYVAPFEVCLALHDDVAMRFVPLSSPACRSFPAVHSAADVAAAAVPASVTFSSAVFPIAVADRGARRRQLFLLAKAHQLGEPRAVRLFAHTVPGNATVAAPPFTRKVRGLASRRTAMFRVPADVAEEVSLTVNGAHPREAVRVSVYDAGVGEGEPLDPPVLMADADIAARGSKKAAAAHRRLQDRVVYSSAVGTVRVSGLKARTGLWVAVFNADPSLAASFTLTVTADTADLIHAGPDSAEGDATAVEADDGY